MRERHLKLPHATGGIIIRGVSELFRCRLEIASVIPQPRPPAITLVVAVTPSVTVCNTRGGCQIRVIKLVLLCGWIECPCKPWRTSSPPDWFISSRNDVHELPSSRPIPSSAFKSSVVSALRRPSSTTSVLPRVTR